MTTQPTIAILLADGRSVDVKLADVASMWWAWDKRSRTRQLMVSVRDGGMQHIYTTSLDWGKAIARLCDTGDRA